MTPTIVTKGGKLFLVVGSPGGPTIITTVLQVISNIVDHGMGVADAVGAKRLHQQWLPDEVRFETGALSGSVSGPVSGSIRSLLEAAGYVLRESKKWGDAEVIEVDPRTHLRTGASDPRSGDSGVAGY
jgi:gamma-glutamyltranspeptidase/glutathione hydrolase